jgi:pullulanase
MKFMKAYLTAEQTIDVILSSPLINHDLASITLRMDYHHTLHYQVSASSMFQTLTKLTLTTDAPLFLGHAYEVIIESFGSTPVDMTQALYFDTFDTVYTYTGNDLGATYTPRQTTFKLWAPLASNVNLKLILANGGKRFAEMNRTEHGVYEVTIEEDLEKALYRYEITNHGLTQQVIDPYGKGSSRNATYSVVVNFDRFQTEMYDRALPPFNYYTEAIIYEAHVRDLTADPTTSIEHKGRFLGMIEEGKTLNHLPIGFDYLTSLGFTHLQLLPVQDYQSVDEFKVGEQYNWGYDPYQYFSLEGSYASNLDDPYSRIEDFIKVVSRFHQAGIRINIDVVYNHVYEFQHSIFEKVVPGYYFRKHQDGTMSNGSFCGNDLNTTRPMVRKLIVDSALFMVNTYHLDGFRFDLMGIIDKETMEQLYQGVKAIRPDFMFYGEGWDMPTALSVEDKCRTENYRTLPYLAFFNDHYRNTMKGGNFEGDLLEKGFILGKDTDNHMVQFLLSGSYNHHLHHPKVQFPYQSINYVECHDNGVFFDKLKAIYPLIKDADVERYTILSLAIVMFSLGIPFFHMGQEIAASKEGQHNSYNLGDRYNMLRYADTSRYQAMIKAFQSLTSLRKKLTLLKQPFEAKHIEFIHHHRHLVEMKLHQENPTSIFFNTSQEALALPKLFGTLLFDGKTSVHTPFDRFHIDAFTCLVVAQS